MADDGIALMSTAGEDNMSSEESITVLFHGKIGPKQVPTNGTDDLTCEAVLQTCLGHVKDQMWGSDTDRQLYGPKYLQTFGLVICPEELTWIPLNHVFKKRTEIQRTYKFRVRFRPPGDHFIDSIMCEYLLLQILDDFLKGPLGKSLAKDKDKRKRMIARDLFGLLQVALMFPIKLPLNINALVDEKFKSRSFTIWNFTKCFSKEIASIFISQPFVDHFWVHKAIKSGIKEYKQQNPPENLQFYAKQFYKLLMDVAPNYCFELYTAHSQAETVTVTLGLYKDNRTQLAVFYGEQLMFSLNDIYGMSLRKPKDLRDMKWQVEIDLMSGPSQFLLFEEESTAESFVTMIQGYFNLYVCYDICFCKQLQTVDSRIRADLKSFGPLGKSTVECNLNDSKSTTEFSKRGFLIHKSLSHFGQFDICSYKISQTEAQSGSAQLRITKSGTIDVVHETQLRLKMDGKEMVFENCLEIRKVLKDEFGGQVCPTNSLRVADINEDFQIDTDIYAYSTSNDVANNKTSFSLPVIKDDLTDVKPIPDLNPLINKYSVYLEEEQMMLVELQSEDGGYSKSFREGLGKLLMMYRIKPSSFLRFYNLVLDAKLSVLMEYAPLHDALTYVCNHPLTVTQKVDIMDQIVLILGVMDKAKLYHGNLRLRKFMVFNSQDAGFVTIKLGDPGVSSCFDDLSLAHPDNIERIPWLSPQRRENLKNITSESEVYAVGTTLYELLYRSDQFRKELKLDCSILEYLNEKKHLPCPPFLADNTGESSTDDIEGNALSPGALEVFEIVWGIIKKCWTEDLTERPTVPDLLDYMKEVKEKVELIEGDTVFETMKNVLYAIGVTKEELPQRGSHLSLNQLKRKYEEILMEKNLPESCIEMDNYKCKIGHGNFGTVWKGRIREPKRSLLPPTGNGNSDSDFSTYVAVKRIKITTDVDRQSMYKEVITACKLNHPNIVRCLYLSHNLQKLTVDKVTYHPLLLIMEYMSEGNLTGYAKRKGDLSTPKLVADMLKVMLDVAEGMVYLSGKSIVHRDLAARNILLTTDCNGVITAKVSDFGLARIMEENYRFYRLNISEALPCFWMPPECLVFDKQPGKFSSQGDVWSYGIVMWEAFSKGVTPRERISESKLISQPIQHDITPGQLLKLYQRKWRLLRNNTMSQPLYNLMLKCWEFEQHGRPPFVDVVQELNKIINNTSVP